MIVVICEYICFLRIKLNAIYQTNNHSSTINIDESIC